MTLTPTLGSTICRPRFSTPRDEAFPTLGPELGEVARRLGKPLMPWQQAVADVAYEFDPVSGRFRYDEVDITVPRQSGKTTLTLAKKVHRLTVMARKLGPQRSTYTAQTRLKARQKLERDFAETLRSARAFREVPHSRARPTKATEWRLTLNNGSEAIQFGSGSYLQIDAPSRTGGHGDTLDDGTIDEAFSQKDDTVEGAMRPSMATRKNAQLWVISTAGDAESAYLYRKVLAGRAATESGNHGRTCYVEYCAGEDEDPGDPRTWWGCMPALGITIAEEFIQGEWERAQRKGQEGINTFLRAYLNRWPEVPMLDEGPADRVIEAARWDALMIGNRQPSAPVLSVEVNLDRSRTTIGAAWLIKDRPHVQVVEDRPGTAWVAARMKELASKYDVPLVVVDSRDTALTPDLESAGLHVGKVTAVERAAACSGIYDRVMASTVTHNGDTAVVDALTIAQWKGKEGARAFTSSGDISALYAITYALHGLASLTSRPGEFLAF